jgi:aspartyl-tRNA(Asn)/glutamyl-tRNA(Gln) amidotransferase subunit A
MIPALDYFRAQRGRARILAEALSTLRDHDVLVSPGVATTALKVRDYLRMDDKRKAELGYRNQLRFTQPFDATGQPALTIPTAIASDGLPIAMQIVGRPFDEAMVLRVAASYEAMRGPLNPPPI